MGEIYVQMYSFADEEKSDEKENFRLAKAAGFDGCELFASNYRIPAEELKAYMQELGLTAISMHVPATEKTLEMLPYAKTMGLPFMGIGMQTMMNDEEVHAFARKLNELGEILAKEGITLTYHNHTQEFMPCEDSIVIDVLMRETNPDYVSFELDAGWCAAAGYDPEEIVKKYSGRFKLIHVKESDRVIGPQKPVKVEEDADGKPIFPENFWEMIEKQKAINCKAGDGLVDWKKLKAVADENGCQAYIVERERTYAGTRFDCMKADVEFYRTQI